jgi:membrane-associated protease RseP (regulator of RpoE activity)
MVKMGILRFTSLLLALVALALSSRDAVAIGGNKESPYGVPSVLQQITGCIFRPISGDGAEIIFCNSSGLLASIGLEVGDVILSINRKPVNDIRALNRVVKAAHAKPQPYEVIVVDHRTGQIALLHAVF